MNIKKNEFVSFVIVFSLLICSCASSDKGISEEVVESTERILESSETIVLATTNSDSEETTETTTDLPFHIPTYVPSECEFIRDYETNRITASYVDDSYIIDFDLDVYDYGVSECSIFTSDYSASNMAAHRADIRDTNWMPICPTASQFIDTTIDSSERREELSVEGALSFHGVDVRTIEALSELSDLVGRFYPMSDNAVAFTYNMHDMIVEDTGCENSIAFITDNPASTNVTDTVVGDITFYTLRSELLGLPLGTPNDTRCISTRNIYGDLTGSIWGVEDDYLTNYYLQEEGIMVDVLYYECSNFVEVESGLQVMPLEDCILNSIPGIAKDIEHSEGTHATVFAAELVYMPFSVGCYQIGNWNFQTYFVPMWAVYCVCDGDTINASTIYLNATTGELVSYGL